MIHSLEEPTYTKIFKDQTLGIQVPKITMEIIRATTISPTISLTTKEEIKAKGERTLEQSDLDLCPKFHSLTEWLPLLLLPLLKFNLRSLLTSLSRLLSSPSRHLSNPSILLSRPHKLPNKPLLRLRSPNKPARREAHLR